MFCTHLPSATRGRFLCSRICRMCCGFTGALSYGELELCLKSNGHQACVSGARSMLSRALGNRYVASLTNMF